jgi:hypothetical protein
MHRTRLAGHCGRGADVGVPGAAFAADEMARHLWHRHSLWQSERQWLDIEVPGWPAGRTFDLEEFAVPGEIPDGDRARWWCRSAPALGFVPIPLELDEFRQPGAGGPSGGQDLSIF